MIMWRQGRTIFIHVSIWLYGVVFRQFHAIFPENLAKGDPSILCVTPARQTCYVALIYFQHIRITDLQFYWCKAENEVTKTGRQNNKVWQESFLKQVSYTHCKLGYLDGVVQRIKDSCLFIHGKNEGNTRCGFTITVYPFILLWDR